MGRRPSLHFLTYNRGDVFSLQTTSYIPDLLFRTRIFRVRSVFSTRTYSYADSNFYACPADGYA